MTEIICRENLYHLRNAHISYAFCLLEGGIPMHLYFGPRLEALNAKSLIQRASFDPDKPFTVQGCTLDHLPQEYPQYGLGDMREGALMVVRQQDGTRSCDLRFVKAQIMEGKPSLEGLPATFGGSCQTLIMTLRDELLGLEADLCYTIFDDCDVIARSIKLSEHLLRPPGAGEGLQPVPGSERAGL